MQNYLKNQTSPYLLQHADNPVHWYPWCVEAFTRARLEDKPVFLSIGYSTCHWCHVMAHESFEDEQIAQILNEHFISIKVDKEERPDIDSIYMSVCQAFTGSGGWPTTIFLTAEQKPFFAGTYFPKTARFGQIGLKELLLAINEKWQTDRALLMQSADEIITLLNREGGAEVVSSDKNGELACQVDESLLYTAFDLYKHMFDEKCGGFGDAPKFPTPHNLLFLMRYYEKNCHKANCGEDDEVKDKYGDKTAMQMVEKTLLQMYRGGMFDHIGGGFSRYSTDRYFLVPHFEKMLYDNALLILAYCKTYQVTGKSVYREVAVKSAEYILREMTSEEGGFYSAQDADSEGVEGKYYLLDESEITMLLGEDVGKAFNEYFDITRKGNFEGKNIPNLLKNEGFSQDMQMYSRESGEFLPKGSILESFVKQLSVVYEYRKSRYALHLDDKILTSWNGLMIAAMCSLYRVTGSKKYLEAAVKAQRFIENKLCENDLLYISYREGKRGGRAFLDDYANEIFALIALYEATYEKYYLEQARRFCEKVVVDFYDEKQGGFFLYGKENEQLILRPKETYDGAVFSGNSAMAYNLVQLYYLTGEDRYKELAERQLGFMSVEAKQYPAGYAMFLVALSDYIDPPEKITVVVKDKSDLQGLTNAGNAENSESLACKIPLDTVVTVVEGATKEYPVINDKTTFYVCKGRSCLPPTNELI